MAARSTVKIGSKVDRIDALVGPIDAIPIRKKVTAITVEISATPRMAAHPRGEDGREKPKNPLAKPKTTPAPVIIISEPVMGEADFKRCVPAMMYREYTRAALIPRAIPRGLPAGLGPTIRAVPEKARRIAKVLTGVSNSLKMIRDNTATIAGYRKSRRDTKPTLAMVRAVKKEKD